ncbi:MAG TPA: c-type cytochrome [Candidatus Kapabacteria bacterium]|nr:c-type cytochrome [Candidatus Kapabacteria bacterium]
MTTTRSVLRRVLPRSLGMLYLAGSILLLAVLAGCELLDPNPGPPGITAPVSGGSDTTVNPGVASDTIPATVERGSALYMQYCARCHGDSVQGTLIWPASLKGHLAIHDIVRTGRRAMPSFPNLSDSAIASIQLYLSSFKVDVAGKTGQELFKAYCASCHGDSATGTTIFAGSLQGHDTIANVVHNGKGDMKPVDIPDSVIAKIQEYLLSFNVDVTKLTGREFYARECARCHGADGEGTTRGYEIRNPVTGYATYVIRTGRPGSPFANAMPSYTTSQLSDAQLGEILEWLRSATHPTDGKSLYGRFCLNCHGSNARSGPAGKNIKSELGDINEKVRSGEGGTAYSNRRKYMPSWSTTQLSSQEVNAIAAYIRTL